jgi:hypothetical protein
MEDFIKLGNQLETDWRAADYDENVFPALAAEGLRVACLPEKYSAWQVLEWTLAQTELPKQRDLPGRFGEPPITIFSGPRFHIDVYFWFHGTTTTHQHGFCGAFQVMHGSSIHSWYEFDLKDKVNSFCEIGEMRLKTCELLNVGDVQEILPGRQYIHGLFHLDHPSVSIVVRTDKSPLFLPQFDYKKPGLAVDPFFEQGATVKKTQVVDALLRAKREDADELIRKLLVDSDFHTAYLVLSAVHNHLSSNSVEQMFGGVSRRDRFAELLSVVEERHADRGDIMRRVFAHHERLQDLVRRRSFVDNPEHRFFFALLLNVDGRERIISLIRDRYPDGDPIEKILDWTYELSQLRLAGAQNQNALGIAGFDDFDLTLVEYLLRGKTDGEMAEIIRQIYPPEKAETLLPTLTDRTATIKNSVVFSPLLANEQ